MTQRDNGFTGTNFERPSFLKMLEEMKKGNINCVIVKDLSRFGRNYTEVGNYIEKIFPFMGVRFISVNDDFDTFSSDMDREVLSMQLKMIMHDYYSKNLSNNIKSVLDKKRQNGEFIGNHPPYGYKQDPNNRKKFVIDEDVAPIIKEIFDLRLKGLGYAEIAKMLNKKGILTPSAYFSKKGYGSCEVKTKNSNWEGYSVKQILKNETYIGNLMQGRTRSDIITGKKQDKLHISKWIIVHGTHDAIINYDVFQKIQELNLVTNRKYLRNRGKHDDYKKNENIFIGIFTCDICGKKITRSSYAAKGKIMKYRYYCRNNFYHNDNSVKISEIKIIHAIECEIERKIALFVHFQDMLLQMKQRKETVSKIETTHKNMTLVKQNITKKENLLKELYEDLSNGIISKNEYDYAKNIYLTKYDSLQSRLRELTEEKNSFDDKFVNENPFAKTVTEYKEGFTLNQEVVDKFIKEIVIFPNDCIEIKYKMEDEFEKLIKFGEKNGVNPYV